MNTEEPIPEPPLTQAESYNTAIQLHNQEFRTLGERTNSFLIVQSILVAAFVMIRVNPELFPYAFPLISGGISMVGIFFVSYITVQVNWVHRLLSGGDSICST